MAESWYYRLFGEEFGPVSREIVSALIASGQISPDDEVRPEGGAWQAVRLIPELATMSAADASSPDSLEEFQNLSEIKILSSAQSRDRVATRSRGLFSAVSERAANSDQFQDLSELQLVDSLPGVAAELPAGSTLASELDDFQVIESATPRPASLGDSRGQNGAAAATGVAPAARTDSAAGAEPEHGLGGADEGNAAGAQWYCEMFGKELGPFSLAELKSLVKTGELGRNAKIRMNLGGRWVTALTIDGLFADGDSGNGSSPVPSGVGGGTTVIQQIFTPVMMGGGMAAAAPAAEAADTPRLELNAGQEWYCVIANQQYGPVDSQALSEWAAEGRLASGDQVRLGVSGAWMPAGSVDGLWQAMKEQVVADVHVQSAEEYAQAAELKANPWQAVQYSATQKNNMGGKKIKARRKLDEYEYESAVNYKLIVVVAVLAVVGIAYFVPSKWIFGSNRETQVYNQLVGHWTKLKEFRKKKDTAGWDGYAKKIGPEIKKLGAELAKGTSAKTPGRQQLLYAVRDHLPKMLADAKQNENSESEKKFSQSLAQARKMLRVKKK